MADHDGASPLAAEAARLVGAVQDWAQQNFPAAADGHDTTCQWCPLCQFMAVLRGDRPEVTQRVAEAGTAVTSALRALLDTSTAPPRPPADPPPPRVQRIDLGPEG